jgi:type I restriction enzyme, S subunit
MHEVITNNLDLWSSALLTKSSAGRGSNGKREAYGIKKLRELILELAVRGKLVPQDPNDEPANVLLEAITREKARLIEEGEIKKEKSFSVINGDEKPFDVPDGWIWQRLGELGYTQTGGTPSTTDKGYFGNDIPFIKPGDIYASYVDYSNEGLSYKGAKALGRTAPAGSILMVCIGTIGKCNSIDRPCAFNQQINSVTPYVEIGSYLLNALKSAYFQKTGWERSSSTTIAILNKGKWEDIVVPIPPVQEQHRIVAKVDELIALCDQLEQQQAHSIEAHQKLVETLLGTLTPVESQQELTEAWTRIANHFDTLFTTEHSIDQLKQTILNLAVMGKLVPQNPNDEPASILLEKIAAVKERLIDEGKIKRRKALPVISDDEKLFDLPQGWEWVRLGDISILKGGFAYSSTDFIDFGKHQVIRMGNIRPDYLRLEEKPACIPEKLGDETADYLIERNDILLTMTGTKGKRDYLYSLIVLPEHLEDRKLYLNQRLCIVRGLLIAPEFINLAIKDDRLLNAIYAQSTGTANQANIGMVALNNWVLPLPPVEEQHRIVAKVDELMALCDALKERFNDAQNTQIHLADAIVEQAVA